MTLLEALKTNLPFRRPSWVDTDDAYVWVQYNPDYADFEWADENGVCTGNTVGDLKQILLQNPNADDYEVYRRLTAVEEGGR